MKIKLDAFEQSIEDNAEKFVPLSETEMSKVTTIINAANKTKNIQCSKVKMCKYYGITRKTVNSLLNGEFHWRYLLH